MLPDENRLDDELVEQVGGGSLDVPELDEATSCKTDYDSEILFVCPNCGYIYRAYEERTDGFCQNCEPGPLKTSISAGEVKTTVPNLSNKDRLVKIH